MENVKVQSENIIIAVSMKTRVICLILFIFDFLNSIFRIVFDLRKFLEQITTNIDTAELQVLNCKHICRGTEV